MDKEKIFIAFLVHKYNNIDIKKAKYWATCMINLLTIKWNEM